jgi:hypothetical protein
MPTTETRYVCRHIFTDGRRCHSPTLRGGSGPEHFCYYHHTTRRPIPTMELRRRRACREPFNLPLVEDRSAIQHAIGEVIQKLAANEIDSRRASILLHGLRIATLNLPKEIPVNPHYAAPLVDEVVLDPDHGLLAPQAELGSTRPKGDAQLMMEKLDREFPRTPAQKAAADAEVAGMLATLRASESPLNPRRIKSLRKNRGRARTSRKHLNPEARKATSTIEN